MRARRSGRYVVTAVDSNGCPSYDSIDVVTSEGVDVSIDSLVNTTICQGDSILLTATTSGNGQQFAWSTGDTAHAIVVRASGVYIARVVGDQGCEAADTVEITVAPIPRIHARLDRTVNGFVGDTVTVSVLLDEITNLVINREMTVSLSYDTALMRPVLPEAELEWLRITSGTLVAGWSVSTVTHTPGGLILSVTAPPTAQRVTTTGLLLRLRFSTFITAGDSLSPQLDAEIPVTVDIPGVGCLESAADAGHVHLVLCGAIHRLIESTGVSYTLDEAHPNPFNPTTEIRFSLGLDGPTRLDILDIRGTVVATLTEEEMGAGDHIVVWNAQRFPSGLYYYRLTSGAWTRMKPVVLVK